MRERIKQALEAALAEGDRCSVSILRLITTAVKDRDDAMRSQGGGRVGDDQITGMLLKMIKQRLVSAERYEQDGRLELVEQERNEIEVIESLLPAQLTDDQMRTVCADTIAQTGAASLRDVGKCMQSLKSRYKGRMDFAKAGALVRGMLR